MRQIYMTYNDLLAYLLDVVTKEAVVVDIGI
jgi:hypothetical protein